MGYFCYLCTNLDKLAQIYYNNIEIELNLGQFLFKFFANLRANLFEFLK